EALRRSGRDARSIIQGALVEVGQPAVLPLIQIIAATEDQNSDSATESFAQDDQSARAAVPEMVSANKKEREAVRVAAINAVAEIGTDAREPIPALVRSVRSNDTTVRQTAVNALGKMTHAGDGVIAALRETLHDSNLAVRLAAARSLSLLGDEPDLF